MRLVQTVGDRDKSRCPVNHRKLLAHPIRANRHFITVQSVTHLERFNPFGFHQPTILANLFKL